MSKIQYHIKKYAETKTYNMGERDKKELQNYYSQAFPKEKKLNIRCSSCVARGLKRLSNSPEPKKEVQPVQSLKKKFNQMLKATKIYQCQSLEK